MENSITKERNVLYVSATDKKALEEGDNLPCCLDLSDAEEIALIADFRYLCAHFCGRIITDLEELASVKGGHIYLCGDIVEILNCVDIMKTAYIIGPFSWGICHNYDDVTVIPLGQVPIIVHELGVYYRKFFSSSTPYFQRIKSEHQFQSLTESDKPGAAFRKGLYLSRVTPSKTFHLLRCSSNLSGPTENFRATDEEILEAVNKEANVVFRQKVELNHVLAQIYENHKQFSFWALFTMFMNYIWTWVCGRKLFPTPFTGPEKKAKIKAHSDKTKDMPREGLIAFCTFYDFGSLQPKLHTNDRFDYCYKNTSVLTTLRFRLKDPIKHPLAITDFKITLYPDSLFIIPLSTNRLYTHEVCPSILDVDKIPTRLGYVIRCSHTRAFHLAGDNYLLDAPDLVPLRKITPEDIAHLRELYRQENLTDEVITYGKIPYSMNSGDYLPPAGGSTFPHDFGEFLRMKTS